MVAQRRYSVTGQTPPDDAEALKARSPKLQALDTTVQSTGCGLCEGSDGTMAMADSGGVAPRARGRQMSQARTVVRTSSKRSATQLPSPNSPSHEPKIARYCLGHHDLDLDLDLDSSSTLDQADTDTDTDTDSDVADVLRERDDDDDDDDDNDMVCDSQATSLASTPDHSSQPPGAYLEKLQLGAKDGSDDDYCMEDLALSPPHSRNQSLDNTHPDDKYAVQQKWLQAYANSSVPLPRTTSVAVSTTTLESPVADQDALTFLTLPPEIRHQVYRHCEELVFTQPLLYCIATAFDKIQHPLASVSRQVRSEALAIFYSYNTWTIKVEFRIMYESFQHWIIRLGDGAGSLRLVDLSVRGTLFKPKRSHTQSVLLHGQLIQITPGVAANGREELYSPPDGDASFKIDLSEKHIGGKVQLLRNDGTPEAGEKARLYLENMVHALWEKRRTGTLNGQDWVTLVDQFISLIGGW